MQFMHRDLVHRTTYVSEGIYENIGVKFRENVVEHITAVIGQEAFDSLYDQISITLTPEANQQILQILENIEYEWSHYDSYSDTIIEGLVIQFFVTTLRGQSISPKWDMVLKSKHLTLVDALHYIQQHYAEDPSLEQTAVAVQCGFQNSNYFCDAFKKVVGISPLKYRKSS